MSLTTKNQFLEALLPDDRARLDSLARPARFAAGAIINEASSSHNSVFFPTSGLVGELVTYGDGRSAVVRLVGPNGVVGAAAGQGDHASPTRALTLTPTEGWMVEAHAFRAMARDSANLMALVDADMRKGLAEAASFAGCAACHRLEERLASLLLRWQAISPDQRLVVTHDLLCQLLGAQRTTVTTMMRTLKLAGVVRSGRGWLHIADAKDLARRSCGCEAPPRYRSGESSAA